MDDNKDYKSENSAGGTEIDGEYHFVRPEKKLYEDAEFVPQDETNDVPHYYVPSEKKPKETKSGHGSGKTLKLICLCLVCALVGGLMGGFVSWNAYKSHLPDAETQKPLVSSSEVKNVSSETATANEIYEIGSQQTVGISLEITSYNIFGQTSSNAVAGTGFVITTDGYIMTNYHVIESAVKNNYKITVIFKDGSSYEAAVAGYEADSDVAVLKIEASELSAVTIGNSDNIGVGDSVFAIGHPLGELDFSMTSGRVSALDRSITADRNTAAINMFQFDAAINAGNSGGPVFNESGEVIGIATAKVGSTGVEGLGFAIPINDAADIANELITKGYVSGKAYLGVNIDNRYTSVYAQYYGLPEGAYVYNVESGSCAEKCGIAAGDIITKLGDEDIASYADLNSAIKQFKAGESAEIVVYRMNDYVTMTVTFDESKPSTDSNGVNEFGLSSHPQTGAVS